jgi:tetratricopeptide (TPR) repeat protein
MLREDWDFLELLGYLYLQYGKDDEARTIYGTLFELADPPSPLLRLTYAYCLAKTGQHAVALHHLEELDPKVFSLKERSALCLLRGNIFWHLGRIREARGELNRFLTTERQRSRREPSRLSLIVQSAATATPAENPRQPLDTSPMVRIRTGQPVRKTATPPSPPKREESGLWKRILRFIARKDIDRELGRKI